MLLGVDVTEIYLPARVDKLAKMGLVPGHSLDFTNGWDFRKAEDIIRAWRLLRSTTPYVVVGSPPCMLLSMLQELNLHIHGDDVEWLQKFDQRWQDAAQHINFCVQCIGGRSTTAGILYMSTRVMPGHGKSTP